MSSAGKTTLASMVLKKLRREGYPSILLDGNETRDLFENRLGYDPESRRKQTNRIKRLTIWSLNQHIIPVVAIIHPFEDDRLRCRKEIPGYCEVYLKCDIDTCIQRDNKNVYQPALDGKAQHVIGIDINYDEPECSDLVLRSDLESPEELFWKLWENVRNRLHDNRSAFGMYGGEQSNELCAMKN